MTERLATAAGWALLAIAAVWFGLLPLLDHVI